MEDELKRQVEIAAERPEVMDAVGRLYDEVQQEIDQRRPLCIVSGRCCRFEEFGHRLFVTTIELASFLSSLQNRAVVSTRLPTQLPVLWDGTGCPYQVTKLCTVHSFRPFGCRMFFCDATSTEWQNDQYERFHSQLKHLHETLQVPYFYVEWRQALRAILE